MEKTQNKKNWDKLTATYYWNINLLASSNTVSKLNGYSKVLDQAEAQDKEYLLKSKIIMFYKYGYLNKERVSFIEIFAKTTDLINIKLDPCIIILYPDHYIIPDLNKDFIFSKYGKFLEAFYIGIKNNTNVLELIKNRKKPISQDEFLNINRIEFKDLQTLYSYSVRLLYNGHAPGLVEDFIFKVKNKYNWLETKKN